jgi:hypothetical protein
MSDLGALAHEEFHAKVRGLVGKTSGKLIIKEYPTASAHVGHFRALLHELKLKKNFTPDVIYIDYINICASSRVKGIGGNVNSYTMIKSIAEEVRGLAVEYNVPIWSATQVNREGMNNSDVDITETSECIAISEKVQLRDGKQKHIGDVQIGDQLTANDDYKTVMFRHHNKMKDCIKITTKSGKSIIVSRDHVFPTKCSDDGKIYRRSYNEGLKVGDILNTVNKSVVCG